MGGKVFSLPFAAGNLENLLVLTEYTNPMLNIKHTHRHTLPHLHWQHHQHRHLCVLVVLFLDNVMMLNVFATICECLCVINSYVKYMCTLQLTFGEWWMDVCVCVRVIVYCNYLYIYLMNKFVDKHHSHQRKKNISWRPMRVMGWNERYFRSIEKRNRRELKLWTDIVSKDGLR